MSKGTFNTPRPTGTVTEIRVANLKIREREFGVPAVVELGLYAEMHEGNEVAGVFEVSEKGNVTLQKSVLSTADQIALDNILKIMIRAYIAEKGYTKVVIT